jgi:hypothetical protein
LNRFTRQIRLAEVGEGGQAKLSAASVALRTEGFARGVEEAYLRGAGVGVAGKGSCYRGQDPGLGECDLGRWTSGADALGLRHAAAREVAEGAYAALLAMREALGVGGAS